MARKHRLHYPGAYFHIIIRGNAQQDIFFTDKDRYRFYLLLQEGIERYEHTIHAFCLMSNHAHLLCQVDTVPLSRIMQNLSFRYARWINWSRNRTGHLFQGRYKAILIDADEYLLQLVAYIHLNPIRAKIVDDAAQYPWSSHKAYLGKEEIPWLSTKPLLAHFGNSIKSAREAFEKMVRNKVKEGHRDDFHVGGKYDGRILGDDDFFESVQVQTDERPVQKLGIDVIIRAVESVYGLEQGELSRGGRNTRLSGARSMAAWAVRDMSAATLTELGRKLGRDVTTLSSATTRLLRRAKTNPDIAQKQDHLKQLLAEFETLQA